MCTVSKLWILVGEALGHDMREYQLYHLGCAVDEVKEGNESILKDYSIKPGSTLVTMKKGLELNVPNAKVGQLSYVRSKAFSNVVFQADVCFLVDCTGSMGPHITAVKNNIQKLGDALQEEYKNCDLVFSFVRYTDFDLEENRTSYLPFTR